MEKYRKKFDECFPLMLTRGMSDEQIEDAIEECLKKNKPYEVDNENDY